MKKEIHRTILLTGASRGIGAATAKHLSACGARMLLLARDAERLAALADSLDSEVLWRACDVRDWTQVQQAVEAAQARWGRVDVLVNNAGVIDPIEAVHASDPADWGRSVDVNLKGAYHCIRAVLPGMLAQGAGRIINLSSRAAEAPFPGLSHYSAAKAGLQSMTRSVHREYFDAGIRVLGLSPGAVNTDMQAHIRRSALVPSRGANARPDLPPEWVAQAVAQLCEGAGDDHLGKDFSLASVDLRRRVGLPDEIPTVDSA